VRRAALVRRLMEQLDPGLAEPPAGRPIDLGVPEV
jgi:hypothetical protein